MCAAVPRRTLGHASAIAGSRAVIEKAKTGHYDAPSERGATADDELNLAFRARPQRAQQGRIAQAAAWFQQTLKGASDFSRRVLSRRDARGGAGATMKRSARGKWRCSARIPARVWCSDALLRTGDAAWRSTSSRTPSAWASDNERLKREAIALAMLGDFSAALPKLKDQLDNTRTTISRCSSSRSMCSTGFISGTRA